MAKKSRNKERFFATLRMTLGAGSIILGAGDCKGPSSKLGASSWAAARRGLSLSS